MRLPISSLSLVALAAIVSGCASVQRYTPESKSQVQLNMARNEYTVLGTVKGSSTEDSYVLGIVRVIDGDKYNILGFKTFEDQYAFTSADAGIFQDIPVLSFLFAGPSVNDRAYFKALAATPDADAVTVKSYDYTRSGFAPFYSKRVVTFTGKAVKYKAD